MAAPASRRGRLRGVARVPGDRRRRRATARRAVEPGGVVPEERRGAEIERALEALAAAADELDALAARLRADGRDTEAEIVETGALMALDPGLAAGVKAAVGGDGLPAEDAILTACAAQADVLAALPDERSPRAPTTCAAWGAGRRCWQRARRRTVADGRDLVLVAEDLGPPTSPSSMPACRQWPGGRRRDRARRDRRPLARRSRWSTELGRCRA